MAFKANDNPCRGIEVEQHEPAGQKWMNYIVWGDPKKSYKEQEVTL